MEQQTLDQLIESQVDDYVVGNISLISKGNLFYFINEIGAFPALENVPCWHIQNIFISLKKSENEKRNI